MKQGDKENQVKYVLVEFQPGDYGEWESVEHVYGPFDTEDEAYDAAARINPSPINARDSRYWVVLLTIVLCSTAATRYPRGASNETGRLKHRPIFADRLKTASKESKEHEILKAGPTYSRADGADGAGVAGCSAQRRRRRRNVDERHEPGVVLGDPVRRRMHQVRTA